MDTLRVEATAPLPDHVSLQTARRFPRTIVQTGEPWGRLFDQRWCRVILPMQKRGPRDARYLEWRDQGEATLYLDGKPHYGFDVAHRRAPLPNDAREAWVECHCMQSAIWHPDASGISESGSIFGGAFLTIRDDDAWHAYHDLKCLDDLMLLELAGTTRTAVGQQPSVEKCPPLQRQLLRALDGLCDAHDTGGPVALRQEAAHVYRRFRRTKPHFSAALVGHAHIDLVWLWPERSGEAKAVHTFATVDNLLSRYPEMRFTASQPASYAAVDRLAPDLSRRVSLHMRAGRWEATGALYVESDTLIACGEALARSFVCGQEDFVALRGKPARVVWLPDVFGYSGCLPQLMRLAGVEHFFTTKLTWSAINRFPHSSFIWRGTDGSEVLAHVTQDSGYNNSVRVDEIVAAARGHAQSDLHPEMLHPVGYGDGGGGPTEEMCERVRRLNALPGMPALKWDRPEAFFDRLARLRDRLPVHHGECYLEYHRGTYTTHGGLKAAFREFEQALQTREAAAVVLARSPELGAVWRRLIFAQFHDYIPGSSIPDVYAEGLPELRRHTAEQIELARTALDTSRGERCVFNPVPLPRRLRHGKQLLDVPALGGVSIDAAVVRSFQPVSARGRTLSNGRVTAQIDERGGLSSLVVEGVAIPLLTGSGRLVAYPDRAANFEAWDIDRQALTLGRLVDTPPKIHRTVVPGGISGSISVTRRVGRDSRATVRFVLEATAAVLRVEVELDWHEPETLLNLHFATDHRGAWSRHGAPFGSVLRPQQPVSMFAEAMWKVPASRWVTVTDDSGGSGMAVMTENKYGFSVRDGNIGVSLVRSPRITGFEQHRAVYPRGLSRLPVASIYSDQGPHLIRVAVAPYSTTGGSRSMHPAALAETLFAPFVEYRGRAVAAPGWLGLEGGETLIPCWAQPLGARSWVLRLHEVGGSRGSARVVLAPGWSAQPVDFFGQARAEPLQNGELSFHPQEILGLLLSG